MEARSPVDVPAICRNQSREFRTGLSLHDYNTVEMHMETQKPVFGSVFGKHLDVVERLSRIFASIAAIIGIFFAGQQIKISTDNARRQTTLEVLKQTQDETFLIAFQRLQIVKDTHQPLDETYTERFITDKNLVITKYDSIAIHYEYGTIDKCLVKEHVRGALDQFVAIQEYLEVPATAYERVSRMRINLDALSCTNAD